ncbi:class I SAM-dependent methyltransferase [Saccharomonospora azurea]|uniref:class I SAM-dependent methyltransferase n=1 Tax=Saccharomonospora azurea TaxID=40988 RepID=UPI00332E05DC
METWFGWTHHRGRGPDESLLGEHPEGARVVDLGCGHGLQAAHLAAAHRWRVTGVDESTAAVTQARTRWHRIPGLEFVQAEVVDYLTGDGPPVDAVYSRFGAAWFVDPQTLLPAVAARLRPGGRLVISHVAPGFREFEIPRWDLPPDAWRELLEGTGFGGVSTESVPCPSDCHYAPCPGILIVCAQRSSPS